MPLSTTMRLPSHPLRDEVGISVLIRRPSHLQTPQSANSAGFFHFQSSSWLKMIETGLIVDGLYAVRAEK